MKNEVLERTNEKKIICIVSRTFHNFPGFLKEARL